jgi:subtilisin family serine protease
VDVAGHGTACADLVRRLAPGAKIVSCRILNRSISATSQALLVALDWVLAGPTVSVVNLSLGTPNRQFGLDIAERVDALYARGIPVVVARGYEDRLDYPSAFGSPFSIAAERLERDDELVHYAGDVVEFGARGFDVEVAWRGGARLNVSGSSFAAPLVAGRLARWKGLDPDLKVWDLKSLLVTQATVKQSNE